MYNILKKLFSSEKKYISIELYNSKMREKAINKTFDIEDIELDKWLNEHLPSDQSLRGMWSDGGDAGPM